MNREQLLRRYEQLGAEIRALITEAPEGVIDEERQSQIDGLKATRKGVLASIQEMDALDGEQRQLGTPPTPGGPGDGLSLDDPSGGDTRGVEVGGTREGEAPFGSFGEQLRAVAAAFSPGGESIDPRLLRIHERESERRAATGMSQTDPSSAGYLVAPEFSQRIFDGLKEDSEALIGLTDQQRVTGESLTFNANAETSRATGSRWGGVQGYWIAEADEIASSRPKFRQVKVEPHELAVLVYATDKLLRNSPASLGQYVERAARDEINFMTGDAIVNGSGAGKPLGILQSGSLITISKESSQAAATLVHANISRMWARLHPRSRARAVWLHNVDIEPELDNLFMPVTNVAGSENVGGLTNLLFNQGQRTLKGRPLIASEYCATLGTKGDLILWDPTAYLTGIREGIRTAMSMHVRFVYAETAFRFMYEIDGQPWLNSALRPFKGSNTLSTHVALAARS